ncbi:MAG: hypothetical protein PQJ59_13820 [Spirochaetales bacterium]|nr:hypothetical protein [Spirochaetales bacterium]
MDNIGDTGGFVKKKLAKGTLLTRQGGQRDVFYVVHTGLVELLYCDEPRTDEWDEALCLKSYRVGMVKGEALLDVASLLGKDKKAPYSIRTVSECVVSATPIESSEMAARIERDMFLNLRILKDMVSQVEAGFYLFRNYRYLWHKYAFIADVLALGKGGRGEGAETVAREGGSLDDYAQYLAGRIAREWDGPKPSQWDVNLFQGEIQDALDLYGDHDSLWLEDRIDHRQYLFIKRIVEKKSNILSALLHNDEPLNSYIFTFLARVQEEILSTTRDLSREIVHLMEQIFTPRGWVSDILNMRKGEDSPLDNFLRYLAVYIVRGRKDTINLLGKDPGRLYPVYSELKPFQDYTAPVISEQSASSEGKGDAKKLRKYEGLLDKILAFSGLPTEFTEEFRSFIDRMLKDSAVLEDRTFLENLNRQYWKLYESCYLKIIGSDLKGFIPGIMLHLGIVDERLLSEEQLWDADRIYTSNLYREEPYPIMTLPYFLEKIYHGDIHPSLTEMGESFNRHIKKQKSQKKNETPLFENTPEDRVRYEISMVSSDLGRMLGRNKVKTLPFLYGKEVSGDLSRLFWSADTLTTQLDEIRGRDYSLFFRECLLKYDNSSDLIQKEVIPYFVFYPQTGSRSLLWQEMDGVKKDTPGRFILPLLFEGDRSRTLSSLMGAFRWELQKAIAGFQWADPVEGGLVGAYFDYIQYYRKNPNLSLEAKKRIGDFIKKTKSDKERFIEDYRNWLYYEYEGRPRLNSVSREIFYRFCPFAREKREVLAAMPLFQSYEGKLQSRRYKEALKIKARLIKLDKAGVDIPQDLTNYMAYLEMDRSED